MGKGPGQFFPTGGGHPHCVMLTTDGLVYVCDRNANRIQVFDKLGNLKRVMYLVPFGAPAKLPASNDGGVLTLKTAGDLAFSRDPQQRLMYVLMTGEARDANGSPDGGRIFIVDRETGAILSQVGGGGKEPGQFVTAHGMSIDSKENLYVAETAPGSRLQRFLKVSK
jgi:DNA-binding beta-propeller fold protein YncE